VLYFGLSPFWTLWWQSGGDSRAELEAPGDLLIGRFDLARRRFLAPLRALPKEERSRASVWDVLAHPNGRIYFTTFFEAAGSIAKDGSDARRYPALGSGLNELALGPDGLIYATRYSDVPEDPARQTRGGLLVFTPTGERVREIAIEPEGGRFRAPKSLAVDPLSGELWLNLDAFAADGGVTYQTLRFDARGRLLAEQTAPPELHFAAFDARGRGWFAESSGGELSLRVARAGAQLARASLGPRSELDFVQDIQFADDGRALLALWSSRVIVAELAPGGALETREIALRRPPECAPPEGRSLLYTAVARRDRLFATLFCGATVLEARLPRAGARR
jgi:hypothetical protein